MHAKICKVDGIERADNNLAQILFSCSAALQKLKFRRSCLLINPNKCTALIEAPPSFSKDNLVITPQKCKFLFMRTLASRVLYLYIMFYPIIAHQIFQAIVCYLNDDSATNILPTWLKSLYAVY